jgi:hypothetical protein
MRGIDVPPRNTPRSMGLRKIVSGGQTGVDRGALDAALACGFPCGGWCPAGRLAEDGAIPTRYPVVELAGADYAKRTRQNVLDSDGTLVIHLGEITGGTLKTVRLCERFERPFLAVDGLSTSVNEVAAKAAAFVEARGIRVLNVAGPRESDHAGARAFSEEAITALLQFLTA